MNYRANMRNKYQKEADAKITLPKPIRTEKRIITLMDGSEHFTTVKIYASPKVLTEKITARAKKA